MNAKRSIAGEALRIAAPLLILAAGFAGAMFLWSLKEPPAIAAPEEKPPLVETVEVAPHDSGLDITTEGLVAPSRDVTIATQVAGKIVYKSPVCEAGEYVAEGMVLFKIDAEDYQIEVDRLSKEREQADANLQEVDLELRNTQDLIELAQEDVQLQQRELQRQLQVRGQAVSQSAVDQARRAELAARNAFQTLENQRRLLETRRGTARIARELTEVKLQRAQLDLSRTEVKAPVSGVIVEEMVEEDSFVPVGAALAKVEDTSTAEVRCSLKMEELHWLWRQPDTRAESPYTRTRFRAEDEPSPEFTGAAPPPGQFAYQIPRAPVTVIYELGGRRFAWEGVLDRFEGIGVDERTRTMPCRVVVADPRAVKQLAPDGGGAAIGPPALVRGMYVRVRIHARPDASLVRAPEEAIRPGGKVWVVREGKLHIEPIEVAAVVDGAAVIDADASNLRAGEQVVVTPLALVQDGMTVEVK
ncbi:MAG: HlyD family efflux transporter periplasmic adaptor subunit [Planctomycetes bacterium]|nr:HlyD family efflux transporter periplasmic adaptor subunit [Planctomycetota bacterium]